MKPENRKIYISFLRALNPFKISTPGRLILEKEVMPGYFPAGGSKVLIVGFQKYNLHYPFFYLGRKVVICEPNLMVRYLKPFWQIFSGRIENMSANGMKEAISLIHFSGVYGWGLDKETDLVRAISIMNSLLAPGGFIIFGYNVSNHNPLKMETEYKKYFSGFEEIVDGICPVLRKDINQIIRVFKKI
jgi:hypothetical protein